MFVEVRIVYKIFEFNNEGHLKLWDGTWSTNDDILAGYETIEQATEALTSMPQTMAHLVILPVVKYL